MDRGQRTVAGLLAVVAVLLGLNLILPRASAFGNVDGACCLPNGKCLFINATQCAGVGGTFNGEGVECQFVNCIPVKPPTVVAGSVWENANSVVRFWSDGTVDFTQLNFGTGCPPSIGCGPGQVIPGACTADVTRNGAVDVGDFLQVLGQWGPCQ